MPSQVRACFVNIITFERCKVYCTYLGTPRETAAAAAVVSIHATDTPSTRSPMFIHVVSSRGEKEDEEEGDDFQNVRTGLIAVRRVVVERRRVRAQPAALAQVDAFFGG